MTEGKLKIAGAKFALTMDPNRRIIRDATILVEDGRIIAVDKAENLKGEAADRTIDASEMVVTPGFVNGHLHISYAHATRGIFPDGLGADYLPNVFKLQSAMNAEEEYYTSLLAITELLKYGTTCFLDPGSTKHLDRCMEAYQTAGCRIIVGTQVADLPNSLNIPVLTTAEAVMAMKDTIDTYHGQLDGRIRAWTMPFSPALSSPELLLAAQELTLDRQTGMTLHFNNSNQYVQQCIKDTGKRPTQYLESLGLLGPDLLLAHVLGLDESEVECLAASQTAAVVCPTAAVKSGSGMTQHGLLPEMLQLGVKVGLGTDAANNSNLLETMRSMYLAAVLYKDAREDVIAIPAEAALEMATITGAQALGLGDDIGSVEPGKKADLVLFDTLRPEWRTLFNPVNNLVYSADGRSVHTVLVDGRIVVENHTPTFVDEKELIQRVQKLGAGLLERTGVSFPSNWPVV